MESRKYTITDLTRLEKLKLLKKMLHYSVRKGDCLICSMSVSEKGYSRIRIFRGETKVRVHRLMMHLMYDMSLFDEDNVNHKSDCISRRCINPEHLYKGTQEENVRDSIKKGNHVKWGMFDGST